MIRQADVRNNRDDVLINAPLPEEGAEYDVRNNLPDF
jgi:hypothetical protein